jgi:sulfonate transport system substrate-binding protein
MKRKNFNLFLALAVLAVLAFSAFSLSACNSKKRISVINIGHPSSGADWPGGVLGVAIENGYLDEYLEPLGYKFSQKSFIGAAPAIHEALVAKELEYVVYAGMAADISKANGIDHTLISVANWGSFWKLIARTSSGIETLAGLRGQKVAYTRGASPHMYLIKVLREAGLTFNDIQPINSTGPESIAGVVSGTIDASVASAGYDIQLVGEGAVKVLHTQFAADRDVFFEPFVFIARTDFHREHPEVAVAIQKAFLKARDWIREDPDRYFRLTAERSGNPLQVVMETADYDIDGAFPLNLDERYINSLIDILAFLRENQLTNGDIDFSSWIDRTVTAKALEEYNGGR